MKRLRIVKDLTGMPLIVSFFVLFSVSMAFALASNCIRCRTDSVSDLVCVGATKFEVISKCGQPDYTDVVAQETEKVEILNYNCGTGQIIKILKMKGGKLVSIEDQLGDRGSGPVKCW